MRRRIAVVGDTLAGGGVILDYEQKTGFSFHGHKTALVGNGAYCETCKSTGVITKAGGPYRMKYGSAYQVALDGDIVLCNCPTPRRIIAELAGQSWCDDRNGSEADYRAYGDSDAATIARGEPESAVHDEQFTLTDANGGPLAGVRYRLRINDQTVLNGVTDASGKTQRLKTDGMKRLRLDIHSNAARA
jgi:hypothetical protein